MVGMAAVVAASKMQAQSGSPGCGTTVAASSSESLLHSFAHAKQYCGNVISSINDTPKDSRLVACVTVGAVPWVMTTVASLYGWFGESFLCVSSSSAEA